MRLWFGIAALAMLYSPVRAMMGTVGELAEFLPSAERTFEILDVKPTIQEAPNAMICPAFTNSPTFTFAPLNCRCM